MQMQDHSDKSWLKQAKKIRKIDWLLLAAFLALLPYLAFLFDREFFK